MEKSLQTQYLPTDRCVDCPWLPQCPSGCSSRSFLGATASKSICNIYNPRPRVKQIFIFEAMPYVFRILCCPHCWFSGPLSQCSILYSWHLLTFFLGTTLRMGHIPHKIQCAIGNANFCPPSFPSFIHIHSTNICLRLYSIPATRKTQNRRDKSPCFV